MAYVAYTELGTDVLPGTVVKEEDYDAEAWSYMITHGTVVVQGGEHDPNVLAARAAGEGYVDPRDTLIADLQSQLAALSPEAATEQKPPVESEQSPEVDS